MTSSEAPRGRWIWACRSHRPDAPASDIDRAIVSADIRLHRDDPLCRAWNERALGLCRRFHTTGIIHPSATTGSSTHSWRSIRCSAIRRSIARSTSRPTARDAFSSAGRPGHSGSASRHGSLDAYALQNVIFWLASGCPDDAMAAADDAARPRALDRMPLLTWPADISSHDATRRPEHAPHRAGHRCI